MSRNIPSTNEGVMFLHCKKCLAEMMAHAPGTSGESMETYARLSVAYTALGFQVWCVRHNVNVMHVDFEGEQHPANLDAIEGVAETTAH